MPSVSLLAVLCSRGEVRQNTIIHHENFAKCNTINAHSVGLTTRRQCPMVANYLEPWLISLNFRNLARFLLQYNLDSGNRLGVIFELICKDSIMPDLTLDECRGLSRDELSQALREEARKMFGNGWIERDFQVKENDLRLLRNLESKQQEMFLFEDIGGGFVFTS